MRITLLVLAAASVGILIGLACTVPSNAQTLAATEIPPAAVEGTGQTAQTREDLAELAEDFNMMYYRRTPIKILLDSKVKQMQTFFGKYEKTSEGDYLQKNLCETLNDTGFAPVGAAEGEQRLTLDNGQIIVNVVYQYKGEGPRPCPPAAVERLGNGIIFHDINGNGGGWRSNEFYMKRDGRHESIRRFHGTDNADVFVEVDKAPN